MLGSVEFAKIVEADRHHRMISAKGLLSERQGALIEQFGTGLFPLCRIDLRKTVQPGGEIGLVWPAGLLQNSQGRHSETLRLGGHALQPVQLGQIV